MEHTDLKGGDVVYSWFISRYEWVTDSCSKPIWVCELSDKADTSVFLSGVKMLLDIAVDYIHQNIYT